MVAGRRTNVDGWTKLSCGSGGGKTSPLYAFWSFYFLEVLTFIVDVGIFPFGEGGELIGIKLEDGM